MKKLHLLCFATVSALGSISSFAQNSEHFYGGIGAGQARSRIDMDRINASVIGTGLTTDSLTRDERDNAYKVFAGYQFNPNFGMEAGYFNLGEFGFKSTMTPLSSLDGRIKVDGYNIDMVGTLPVNDHLSFLGRIGLHNARTRDTFTSTGALSLSNSDRDMKETNYKSGVGFSYQFNPSVTLRGELERYRVNDAMGSKSNIDVASLSLVFPFGRTPEPAPKTSDRAVYQDVPVVVVTPPVEEPVTENVRVSFNADVMFGFNRAEVSPAGKRALDKFIAELNGVQYDHITIEGHTDRIGAQAYNEKLSRKRADAVKTYLIASGEIPAYKITSIGKGSSEPVTDANTCKGLHTSAAVIACLEPDRRVDVSVSGSQPAKRYGH